MILLNVPMLLLVGQKYYRAAFLSGLHGSFGMDALVVTGTSASFLYSMAQVLMECSTHVPTTHVFFEAAGMLLMVSEPLIFRLTGSYLI
jgi:Cu+-exporting ATPase